MLVLRIRGVLQSLRHVDSSRTAAQSRVVGTSSAQMEAQGTGDSSGREFRLFSNWYYLTHCLGRVKPNRVDKNYRRDDRKAQKDTSPPLPERAWVCRSSAFTFRSATHPQGDGSTSGSAWARSCGYALNALRDESTTGLGSPRSV